MPKMNQAQEPLARFTPYTEYLEGLDILTVCLNNNAIARSRKGGSVWTNVDLDAEGNVVEVEFINAARFGVDLSSLPEPGHVERLIRNGGFDVAMRVSARDRDRLPYP
jgi:hypothetical protein